MNSVRKGEIERAGSAFRLLSRRVFEKSLKLLGWLFKRTPCPCFKQSFDLQVFVEVSRFKEFHDFLLCSICLLDSTHNQQSLYTTTAQMTWTGALISSVSFAVFCV